ncbi:MAG: hypothetical protein KW802_04085, partial [Candidatus Doudnabacteria bacterium]|nr:hypothetical protein [Candidatus Doudnabacteria bacterium]
MIATSHVIIGGALGLAVGTVTKNPALALAAGIVSHFVCDLVPHLDGPVVPPLTDDQEIVWSRGLLAFAITDSLLAIAITFYFWITKDNYNFASMFAWGAAGGYLPDLLDNFPVWAKYFHQTSFGNRFHRFHLSIHDSWQKHFPMARYWPLGIATQIVIALPCP